MKILVLGSRIPYPLHDGGAIATYNMLKTMAELGHEITYFSFNTKKHSQDPGQIRAAFPFCRVIPHEIDASVKPMGAIFSLLDGSSYNLRRFRSELATESLKKLLMEEAFDLIHFEGLFTISFLAVAKSIFKGPLVFRAHNVEYRIWETLALAEINPLKKIYLKILASRLKREETRALAAFKAIVAITESDEKEFRKLAPKSKHFIYPAGFISPESPITEGRINTLFHIGSMEWKPNVQGVEWLVQEVFPRIRAKNPSAELHLAGKGLKKEDKRFIADAVFNHGEVDDSAAFMAEYRIMCVPLKSGSGLRMKTLEAMFMKRAVVSTPIGAEGLDKNVVKHLEIVENSADFASAAISLLQEKDVYSERVLAGYSAAIRAYSPLENTRKLISFYEKLLA